jgi:hypothetical protein
MEPGEPHARGPVDAADFELSTALAAWRARMTRAGLSADATAELEDHLREDFAARVAAGAAPSSAWAVAEQHLGSPAALAREFARIVPPLPAPLAWLGLGYLAISSVSQACALAGDLGQILGASYLARTTLELVLLLGLAWILVRRAERLLTRPVTALVVLFLTKLALHGATQGLHWWTRRFLSMEATTHLLIGGGVSRAAFQLLLFLCSVSYLVVRRRRDRLIASTN